MLAEATRIIRVLTAVAKRVRFKISPAHSECERIAEND
jgi:hypothetical protein